MKKFILIIAILSFGFAFSNTNKEEFDSVSNVVEITDLQFSYENVFVNEAIFIQEYLVFISYQKTFFMQLGICAQVQMDVANSFQGNPMFTTEQVNEMALGAFMGCMGWL
jgi:hypothetical protein